MGSIIEMLGETAMKISFENVKIFPMI